jgi:hypothetical protein
VWVKFDPVDVRKFSPSGWNTCRQNKPVNNSSPFRRKQGNPRFVSITAWHTSFPRVSVQKIHGQVDALQFLYVPTSAAVYSSTVVLYRASATMYSRSTKQPLSSPTSVRNEESEGARCVSARMGAPDYLTGLKIFVL